MTIRYIPEGDKFKANQLWGEARHQLSILKNSMSFQNLKQDQKLVRFNDGTIIKCISCFGQDVVRVFVPQQVGKVKYKEDRYIRYMPAIEVYDKRWRWHGSTYLGVVLCKGGGFEPPYEFVPKDSLPDDKYWKEPEALPKERLLYYSEERKLDDIAPKGVTDTDFVDKTATISEVSSPGGYIGKITNVHRFWFHGNIWCWRYWGCSGWHFAYTRTESLNVEYGLSYSLPGEADPGRWPSYVYEGRTWTAGLKPNHLLNLGNFYRTVQGSGSNEFIPWVFEIVGRLAEKFVDGHWERDDENVNFDSVAALAEAYVPEDHPEFTFPKRLYFRRDNYNLSHLSDFYEPWHQRGSVMDENHYALIYSLRHIRYGEAYNRPIADLKKCIPLYDYTCPEDCVAPAEEVITDEQTEGPLNVVVDGVIFELFPATANIEDSPKLQDCNLKYFRVGEKSIGLFYIGKNHNDPIDYMYVYASVTPEGNKLVVTEMPEENAIIPGVTDLEGNPVYTHGGLRLIRETITEEKEIVEN